MRRFLFLFLLLSGCVYSEDKQGNQLPLIVLCFDDGSHSIYDLALPEMKKFNYPGVNYIPTGLIDLPGSLSLKECREMENLGWETGGHTVSHANLTTIPLDSARSEIKRNYEDLVRMGLRHSSFALPAGHANDEIIEIIKKWFPIIRTSQNYRYQTPLNVDRLGYYQVQNNDNLSTLNLRVSHGILENEGLIIFGFHSFTQGQSQLLTEIQMSVFQSFLLELNKKKLEVVTLTEAVHRLK